MEITQTIIDKSVTQQPFGTFEPFLTGDDDDAASFYRGVLSVLEKLPGVSVVRELDHYGSGYASYVAAFLHPSDGRSQRDFVYYIETTGLLLYLSRLAPIAVFGASSRTDNKRDKGSSSGFIDVDNVGRLPDGDWAPFLATITACLHSFRIEFLPREPLLLPAPDGVSIPTLFDPPYHVFDTLFYWMD